MHGQQNIKKKNRFECGIIDVANSRTHQTQLTMCITWYRQLLPCYVGCTVL